jgi:excinuclease ABC subunit C
MITRQFLQTTPHAPGVYLMIGKRSEVLYVGKAKDLHKRLSSYARVDESSHSKTAVMVRQLVKADLLITNTEKEALILESSLIKKHRPKYNVILRDDKNYPLIKVTVQEQWPRVFMTRRKTQDGARYFGPYSSSSAMWSTLKFISAHFPLRRCKTRELTNRKRPCLNYQLNQCQAPCAGKADHAHYLEMVDKVLLFLDGKNHQLLQDLQQDMAKAAQKLEYERAALLRNQVQALKKTLERQQAVSQSGKDQDIYSLYRDSGSVSIALLIIRDGVLRDSKTYYFDDPHGDDATILSQVLQQRYDIRAAPPREIVVPVTMDDQQIFTEWLTELASYKVRLIIPRRGERKRLLDMAQANARQHLLEHDNRSRSWQELSHRMEKKLHLSMTPEIIECVDISNISGTTPVGSLVRFEHGSAAKKGYRHYNIVDVDTINDYAMMKEVLRRRFTSHSDNIPHVLMVDGGKGQLSIAELVVEEMNLSTRPDLIAIAKGRHDGQEKLFRPGRKNPIILKPHDPILLFLMNIRDEAHRFGVTFHRKKRTKKAISSRLDQIPGVGAHRRKKLLAYFGSVQGVAQASPAELQMVDTIGDELAQIIHDFFHRKD